MFLIDKPYVSSFLVKTIKENNFQIVATTVAKELITDDSLNWVEEKKAISMIKNNPELRVYTNSENALGWIEENLGETNLYNQINLLKNKASFRKVIKDLYPDFNYKELKIEAIHKLESKDISFPFVIKPSVGFLSIGVHIVLNEADWVKAKKELSIENLKSIFPPSVLNTSNFIIEDYIAGEEYAVDYYYDNDGNVVILNVLHHIFSSGTDTSDRVYYTSKETIKQYKSILESFLYEVGKKMNIKNFPGHAEVKIDENNKIVPIEINPLRFGGWCTSGDLAGISLENNSYEYYINNKIPNWDEIFKGKESKKYSIAILDNNSGISLSNISNFDYIKLAKDFEKPILIRELDINTYNLFGFVFAETANSKSNELTDILTSDLRKYITHSEV
jgi:hypothetical protein